MKKVILILSILFLIIFTTITKNSTKKLDNQIFNIKENIRVLKDKYELVLLDYNFLTSPKKLMEYQKTYFEDNFIQKDFENLNWITINDKIFINKSENKNE